MRTLPPTLLICCHSRTGAGSCTGNGGGAPLRDALAAEVAARDLPWQVAGIGCLGRCDLGPNLRAAPGGPVLTGCRADDAARLVERLQAEWTIAPPGRG